MIVTLSWYADGSGQPEVMFSISYREGSGFYVHSGLIENIRDTQHKECRVYEVRDDSYTLLYDSTNPKERTQCQQQ